MNHFTFQLTLNVLTKVNVDINRNVKSAQRRIQHRCRVTWPLALSRRYYRVFAILRVISVIELLHYIPNIPAQIANIYADANPACGPVVGIIAFVLRMLESLITYLFAGLIFFIYISYSLRYRQLLKSMMPLCCRRH